MTLRAKLFLAQAPLAIALFVLAVVSFRAAERLGDNSQLILRHNYRSVLAAQTMKESIEQMDGAALSLVAGAAQKAQEQYWPSQKRFEKELRAQEGNITETGEQELTARLRVAWERYQRAFERLPTLPANSRKGYYFRELQDSFLDVKFAADGILSLNQTTMVAQSDAARRDAQAVRALLWAVSAAALFGGLLASTWLTRRLLRPLTAVTHAVRRLGEGDLAARAPVEGHDEIARMASEFNKMAERLAEYRRSSLGELLQAQQGLQAAIDSLPDPVLVFDSRGSITSFNTAAETMQPQLKTASDALQTLDPKMHEAIKHARLHIAEGKGIYHPKGYDEAIQLRRSDGDHFFVPRGSAVYGETGEVVGATIILQDVTRLRRVDELKNDLVATVAHEMKTPLTSLHMAIHVCLDQGIGPLNAKQAELLYAAREDCERLQSTIEEILDLARIQSGSVQLHLEPILAGDIARKALDDHGAEVHEHALKVELVDSYRGRVLADPDRIQLVMGNLISNAVRYSNSGGDIQVAVALQGDRIRFRVTDQGPGISKEAQTRIFEKFFRASALPGGAGLGLYIAREIVAAHGGQIGLESEPGLGSTFWFTLPKA